MNEKLLKEILRTLLSDSIRQLYIEKRSSQNDFDRRDIQEAIEEREELLERLEEKEVV